MKRILLSIASAMIVSTAFCQFTAKPTPQQAKQAVPVPLEINEGAIGEASQVQNNGGFAPVQRTVTETQIGETTYDLQTNSSIQRRTIRNSNGTTIATWTYSPSPAPTSFVWPVRGTGYNYFNGTTWGTSPTATIESASERTGWPNPLRTGFGKEVIIAHSTQNSIFHQMDRSTVGTGAWTQANLSTQNGQVWGRSVVGGPNNNTIHMIGMTLPIANDGQLYNGMDGAFLYNRSTNGGSSLDIIDYTIPGTGVQYFDGFDGDNYAIEARGTTVAIAVAAIGRGVQLFKSTNNGFSWTKTDVMLSDVWYDVDATLVDTVDGNRLYSSDGSVAVMIDDNDMCHVWFGGMNIANLQDGQGTLFFPFTGSMEYWNEDFPGSQTLQLFGALDTDGNGVLDLNNSGGRYRLAGLVSHPHVGVDDQGCWYLSFSALREDLEANSMHYRHIYVTKSCDNGCSWSVPIDVTGSSNNDFTECIYQSMAKRVDSKIHMTYQADINPGYSVQEGHQPGVNKIIYLSEDATRFDTTTFCPTQVVGDLTICPGGSTELEALGCASQYAWTGPSGFTSTSQVVQATSVGTYSCAMTTSCGVQTETVEITANSGSNEVAVNLVASSLEMCPGGNVTITANTNIGGVDYLWSTSEATPSISVTNPGTYTVTISDCNAGTVVESVVITQPTNAPVVSIDGDLSICPGDENTLTASPATGASYAWSTGPTTMSLDVNTAGTYTVTVTNCAGSSSASVVVTAESLPTAAVTGETAGCDGEVLTVTASGGSNFEWSDGSTEPTFSISSVGASGTYTVTVSNDCGDTDVASVALSINAAPATPSLTFDGSYNSSQSGTHQWYVEGVLVNGQTGSSLAGSFVPYEETVYCIYIDENGCTSPASLALVGIQSANTFDQSFNVFPNPSNGQFDVRFADVSGEVKVSMTNSLGQVLYNRSIQAKPNSVESIGLSAEPGVYQLKLEGAEGISVRSIIIE